jgi:hypothetical protein
LAGNWIEFWELEFWGKLQRRGVHVNIPEIGSRGGQKCFWGNLGFYAELRRELVVGFGDVSILVGFGGISTWLSGGGGALCAT